MMFNMHLKGLLILFHTVEYILLAVKKICQISKINCDPKLANNNPLFGLVTTLVLLICSTKLVAISQPSFLVWLIWTIYY